MSRRQTCPRRARRWARHPSPGSAANRCRLNHVRRPGVGTHTDPQPASSVAGEAVQCATAACRNQWAVHDRRTGVGDDLQVTTGPVDTARTRNPGNVRQQNTRRQEPHSGEPFGRTDTIPRQDHLVLDARLTAMQSHRHVQLNRARAVHEQFRRAGFDPIGRQLVRTRPP